MFKSSKSPSKSYFRHTSGENDRVTFRYKDCRQQGAQKQMTLDAIEFLRRFCMHILPPRFVMIRHYGFLSSRRKGSELPKLQVVRQLAVQQIPRHKLTWQEVSRQWPGFDPELCPCCQNGKMLTIELRQPRSPPYLVTDWIQACRQKSGCRPKVGLTQPCLVQPKSIVRGSFSAEIIPKLAEKRR